ncbi:Acyl-coenzyme A:6-aminopenicillanic-acid-acyltransferase 40 kDa form [Tolypocladium ophioglossoides CBS 100239]|uniref:Acyl-coenzyme A:6-aminopenicillanic-acid-acyltransferase 40 kDa form n=1 Tax=Tolypocladium ophioglossoides (strain CBS 100239) TaxID=1163406 RepID=A0A0L0N8E2_TOLOC|nr:Acyl-coenzyme A:6-aminopenicillanic-acid-acyltransferase 40 kDa form [Tolypocladium ophioglossoides CBS 100239]
MRLQDSSTDASVYQHVVVRGLPYERGLSHGQQARSKVRANVEYYRRPGKLASSTGVHAGSELMNAIIDHVYTPALQDYYPSGYQEMQGIADGAGVSLQDVVLLNSRYDLARLGDEPGSRPVPLPLGTDAAAVARGAGDDANECTSAFFSSEATPDGDWLVAQNWDMSARLWEDDCIIYLEVHPDASENRPSMFLVTEAGQLGRSGMNSAGLGVAANSLMSSDDYVPLAYVDGRGAIHGQALQKMLPISMLRRMILESNHLAEALTAAYNFPRHVSNNLTVSTAEGFGLCLEVTPHRINKVYRRIDDNYLVHANHFVSPAAAGVQCRYPGGSSWFRQQRLEALVRARAQSKLLRPELLVEALSDHLSFPEGLCVHPDRSPVDAVLRHLPGYPFRGISATVVCVVYNLTKREVTVCKGPPCQGVFQTFKVEGRLGNQLGARTATDAHDRPERP